MSKAEILELTKMSYIVTLGLSVYSLASGLIDPTIAPYLDVLGNTSEQIGSILSYRWILVAVLSIPFALLSTRIGEVRVLQISAIFAMFGGIALYTLPGTKAVSYFYILSGFASAASSGPAAAILAENTGTKRVAAFALYSITWQVPPALGSGISAYWFSGVETYTAENISSIFVVVFYVSIIGSILYLLLLQISQREIAREETLGIAKEFRILFAPIVILPIILLMIVNFLAGAGAGATLPFLPPYLKSIGANPTQLSLLVLALNISMAFATQFVTPLAKKFGDLQVYAVTTFLSTVFLVSLVFSDDLYIASFFFIGRGTFANMNAPIAQAKIFTYIDNRARATGAAVTSNIRWVGWSLASPVSGRIIDTYGYEVSFVFTAIIYIVAMSIFLWTVSTRSTIADVHDSQILNIT